ncbi:serine hydrolase domain-containing protein [Cystobacter ferrugineus]|uniref:Serine hydrolase n=1 Tax=Cystobacter ferrugineus TaxID=83449 RepID=A0A1L9BB19_9BACT|nr:serine hydrolase domain-containing protein [Cystobacter ferrugineus]OJH39393.1 serine hydrolase [Cystobacter ferrugineus]
MPIRWTTLALLGALAGCAPAVHTPPSPSPTLSPDIEAADARVRAAIASGELKGLALAFIEDGQVKTVRSYGQRNAAGEPLRTETVMYGASLTKAVFAYTVMQLVDEGRIDLDASIARYLDRPLPDHPRDPRSGPWPDLREDPRWKDLTPRILLSHRSGFANFAFLEPDGKLRFHFDPGSRYAYSGEGLILLQFVLEKGLGLDLGQEMQRRVFDRFGMHNTSMMWRPDFAANLADGITEDRQWQPHDERGKVRAAGSMDTTLEDFARFAAGFMRGEGLSARSRAEMVRAQWPITTATQFPSLQPELAPAQRRPDLAAGLGVIVFDGPQGRGFFKGGHDDTTGNTWVCVERRRACVVLLANDVKAEALFPGLVRQLLGETGVPWSWEYGEMSMR